MKFFLVFGKTRDFDSILDILGTSLWTSAYSSSVWHKPCREWTPPLPLWSRGEVCNPHQFSWTTQEGGGLEWGMASQRWYCYFCSCFWTWCNNLDRAWVAKSLNSAYVKCNIFVVVVTNFFYLYEYLYCMYVCAPCVYLVPMEIRRRHCLSWS